MLRYFTFNLESFCTSDNGTRLHKTLSGVLASLRASCGLSDLVSRTSHAQYQRGKACNMGKLGHFSLCVASPAIHHKQKKVYDNDNARLIQAICPISKG